MLSGSLSFAVHVRRTRAPARVKALPKVLARASLLARPFAPAAQRFLRRENPHCQHRGCSLPNNSALLVTSVVFVNPFVSKLTSPIRTKRQIVQLIGIEARQRMIK